MTDKIGVLGEASTLTAATTTVYTCPADKAAKCRIMYLGQADAGGIIDFKITVNGIDVFSQANITASNYIFSSPNAMFEKIATLPTGVDGDTTCAPAPIDYYLAAGDTVTYTIADASAISLSVQVVGTEVDV